MHLISHPSPNFGPRPDGAEIDILVLHYTGMQTGQAALDRLCDPQSKVSCHYLVEEDGRVFKLVDEDMRAWHAGRGIWQGCEDVNSRSIGIEIVNPGHEFGYRPFPYIQISAVINLCRDILARHAIPPDRIIAHSDMAPDRKEDPGELFPWAQLAQHGIGLWPVLQDTPHGAGNIADIDTMLIRLGYGPAQGDKNRVAFQRHWRPSNIDGKADQACADILAGLLAVRNQ
ncbi:MAG: N-acetylmuramoyl-L-alanine amidase [Pseudomonadota bacterium]